MKEHDHLTEIFTPYHTRRYGRPKETVHMWEPHRETENSPNTRTNYLQDLLRNKRYEPEFDRKVIVKKINKYMPLVVKYLFGIPFKKQLLYYDMYSNDGRNFNYEDNVALPGDEILDDGYFDNNAREQVDIRKIAQGSPTDGRRFSYYYPDILSYKKRQSKPQTPYRRPRVYRSYITSKRRPYQGSHLPWKYHAPYPWNRNNMNKQFVLRQNAYLRPAQPRNSFELFSSGTMNRYYEPMEPEIMPISSEESLLKNMQTSNKDYEEPIGIPISRDMFGFTGKVAYPKVTKHNFPQKFRSFRLIGPKGQTGRSGTGIPDHTMLGRITSRRPFHNADNLLTPANHIFDPDRLAAQHHMLYNVDIDSENVLNDPVSVVGFEENELDITGSGKLDDHSRQQYSEEDKHNKDGSHVGEKGILEENAKYNDNPYDNTYQEYMYADMENDFSDWDRRTQNDYGIWNPNTLNEYGYLNNRILNQNSYPNSLRTYKVYLHNDSNRRPSRELRRYLNPRYVNSYTRIGTQSHIPNDIQHGNTNINNKHPRMREEFSAQRHYFGVTRAPYY